MADDLRIRLAEPADIDAVLAMMPRLAMFELPEQRDARDLWRHDAATAQRWADGDAPNCRIHVAEVDGDIVGLAMVTMRPELLSEAPSAHLEALAVSDGFEGRGLGHGLMQAAEQDALEQGAESITLHVFARNERARALYERRGFDGELMRYIKRFDDKDA
ncbi:MAG: GNAT family N-acetyltransferase [Pseudomonadota bacterium]